MANFGAKILNNAVGSLLAQQAVIATTGNNIANANTIGYTQRTLTLETRAQQGNSGTLNVGNGVQIGDITRISDAFLEQALRDALGDQAGYGLEADFLGRVEDLFRLSGAGDTIGSTLTGFFDAINDLRLNPSSIELRQNVLERAEDLVTAIKNTYNSIAQLQNEADDRIGTEIETVNSITQQIAVLNGQISTREAAGFGAPDERDQRDILLRQLAERISFTLVEQNDGTLNVVLPNGFPIVSGTTARALSVTETPSFAGGSPPPALDGSALNYIVYDYDQTAGEAHVDLTSILKDGTGSIAGLLRVRGTNDAGNTSAFEGDGALVAMATRVEALTRTLLTTLNRTYLGSDENGGLAGHQPSSGDLDGNAPAVYGLFTFEFGGTRDADGDGLPDDLTNPALGIDNFSSILQVTITDPRDLAAALDLDTAAGSTSFAEGDGQNLEALANLQSANNTFALGAFSFTGTFEDVYSEAVSHLGNLSTRAAINSAVANDEVVTAENRRDEVSAVSLDEQFTKLISAQKAYQFSARMIRIADELLDEIVRLI